MLTKKQRIQIILLTQDSKYGQLLADAYDSWTQKNLIPFRELMGLDITNNLRHISNQNCCLQGAALNDKKCININSWGQSSPYKDIKEYYNLTEQEAESMRAGFDWSKSCAVEYDHPAYLFGRKVNKIIFKES